MHYMVLGAAGQLGRDLCSRLPDRVSAMTRADADLTRTDQLAQALRSLRPDVVINCAAYNFVDRAESEPEAAFAVNAWGVRSLAGVCRELDALLVHFSSDHVFGLDADRRHPCTEEDAPGPVSVYGLSKLAGEYLVRTLCPQHLIVRTCGLYGLWGSGGKGGNFVETMLRLAREGRPVRVVADQICTPSATADVADAVVALLQRGARGIVHVTNSGPCSWHDFAAAIFRLAAVPANLTPITTGEFGAAARRPAYSVLAATGLVRLGLPPLRPWQQALAAYLGLRRQHNRP
jgi:dTDP-4-dehydrorhamnose reductase